MIEVSYDCMLCLLLKTLISSLTVSRVHKVSTLFTTTQHYK